MPQHPQEVAKASQDLLTQSFGKVYDLNVEVTRCGNFFGPYDFNFARIVPYMAKCCALGEQPELRSNGASCEIFSLLKRPRVCTFASGTAFMRAAP
jgi:dTDP-D-glucose 4,6-dehydratase